MKKVKQYKGFVIALNRSDSSYVVFTKDEWSYGEGCRYPEHDGCGSIEEAMDFIKSY